MLKAHHTARHIVVSLTGILLAGTALVGPAIAGPSGGVVVGGAADIAGQGSDAVTINQNTNRVVIDWQNFDTEAHQSVTFNQLDSSSIALNRVLSGSPTQFDGALNANGNVIIMNGNGVVFGGSSRVDVNGLIATSVNVSTDSFMNDAQIRFDHAGDPNAKIINHGIITAKEAGLVGFVAPHVENSGIINARLGKVQLASGDRFTFDLYGDGLVSIAASDELNNQLAKNSGTIKADGGVVQIKASAAKNVVDALVSNTGVIEAKTVSQKNGVIILGGDTATTSVSGTLNASGKNLNESGGRIEVTGKKINVQNATIDASGHAGGGDIRIGGGYKGGEGITWADTTTVDADTTITADATHNGDGGTIVVWSEDLTDISAKLSAKGGAQSGDGGLIETSSKGRVIFQNTIDINTSASHGNTGLWYIDPTNFTIADVGGDITTATLAGQLAANNITIETADAGGDAGDIFVQNALSWNSDRILTLNAHRNIDISAAITNTSGGSLILRADKLGSGTGTVSFSGAGSISMTGGGRTDIYYNPTAYTSATNYSGNVTGPFTAWMLVNNVTQLQAINTDNTTRAGRYALGRDIDASDTVNWNAGAGFVPIGTSSNRFTGQFDGLNHIITDLTINRPTISYVGLFGRVDGGTIQNVGLENISMLGATYVGGLAGYAHDNSFIDHTYITGTIIGRASFIGGLVGYLNIDSAVHNSYAKGSVMGESSYIGGLVGTSIGNSIVTRSYATNDVTGYSRSGGLVGSNSDGSTITHSYATGMVIGDSFVGGLTGYNNTGIVEHSYATGIVAGTNYIGGLVGINNTAGSISHSYATGSSTASGIYVGGLVGRNNNSSTINYGHSSGAVSGGGYIGGLVGSSLGGSTVSNSYWDMDTSGRATSSGGGGAVGLTSVQARQQASYVGWDFAADWYMINNETRPFGRWEHSTTITNAHQLQLMAMDLSAHYTLARNIDFGSAFASPSGMWGDAGFVSIGNDTNAFTGQLDGLEHVILELFINRPSTNFVGLFGYISNAGIQNIGLKDINITGRIQVGGLVGTSNSGSLISNNYSTGSISGSTYVGGLVGHNKNSIIETSYSNVYATATSSYVGGLAGYNGSGGVVSHSYATGTVIGGTERVGGLVGSNYEDGTVTHSYATGDVTGIEKVGGLVGFNYNGSSISKSYATGNVTGSSYVGGLLGQNAASAVTYSYASGVVTGNTYIGGLIGSTGIAGSNVANNFWDMDSSGLTSAGSTGAVGLTSAQARQQSSYVGWDFNNDWFMINWQTRPFGRWEHSTTITNAHQLQLMAMDLSAHYTLARNIDFGSAFSTPSGMWGSSGFNPIGNGATTFTGQLDGLGHVISGLFINRPDTNHIGLFGHSSGSIIRNIGLEDVNIKGSTQVGGLVGRHGLGSVVENSYSSGTVNGANYIGGLVGHNNESYIYDSYSVANVSASDVSSSSGMAGGLIGINNSNSAVHNSYATGKVRGSENVGGLIGRNQSDSIIIHSHASGDVFGTSYVGGLVGYNYTRSTINNSYSTGDAVGSSSVGGLVGLNQNASIVNQSYATGGVTGDLRIGGLVGYNHSNSMINNSYAAGTVTGSGDHIGGLVGYNHINSMVNHSHATGNVSGENRIGGLVGYNFTDSTVTKSYATGSVLGNIYVGGLIGFNYHHSTVNQSYASGSVVGQDGVGGLIGRNNVGATVNQSYATGFVSGVSDVGGLIGSNINNSTVTNSYWNVDSSGQTTSAGGAGAVGLTTAQMMQLDSFAGWDIDDAGGTGAVWRIYEGQTSPLLRHFMTTLTVTSGNDSFVYDGNAYAGGNGVVWSGFRPGEDVTDLYGSLAYDGTAQGAVNAGNYTITPNGYYSGQHGYDIKTVSGTLTITPRDITIAANTASRVYGNANPGFTYSVGGDGLVNGDTLSGALASAATITSNVGDYAITQGTLSGGGNYNITSYTGADLTITQRGITITADAASRIYGNANPSFTYTVGGDGLVNGDTLSGALASAATITSNVGDYAITQGTLSGGGNYNITSYTGADLTITQRGITITADAASRIYGNANPGFTYTVGGDGLVNGDTLSGALASAATITSNVGDYAITQGTLSGGGNYNITSYTGADLTITQRSLVITAHNKLRVLGQANPALTYGVGGDGLANGDAITGDLFTVADISSVPGSYAITQGTVIANNPNYAVTFNQGVLTVTSTGASIHVPTIDTGRKNSIMVPQPIKDTVMEIALVTGSQGSGDLYNVDLTQNQVAGEDGLVELNEVVPNASDRLMSDFYKVYFTKELLWQLGYVGR